MHWKDQLPSITRKLTAGESAAPVTVREFLSWFSAQRRGYAIVRRIRYALKKAGLTTEPDFESAFIESEIHFRLTGETSSPKPSSNPAISPIDRISNDLSGRTNGYFSRVRPYLSN
jgi:hypothetical protein